jgi:hypothetical protein
MLTRIVLAITPSGSVAALLAAENIKNFEPLKIADGRIFTTAGH